jgi:hypothetical protein
LEIDPFSLPRRKRSPLAEEPPDQGDEDDGHDDADDERVPAATPSANAPAAAEVMDAREATSRFHANGRG